MKLTLKVTTSNSDAHEVVTNLSTVIAWERKFNAKSSSLANAIGMEDLAFMAWHASMACGITVPIVFDDYIKNLEAIEVVSQETPNPTNGEVTHES